MFKIIVQNRNYDEWEIYEMGNLKKIKMDINPIENKLFTNDVFSFENNCVKIIHSSIRSGSPMPAVLMLIGNKTYGREKKNNNKGKLLYKCVPDDIRIPSFLVPYEIKTMDFSKVFKNMYVTIYFENWDSKHPIGKINQVIGPVDILDHFYEYQLYCKSLNTSIQKFQKETIKAIKNKPHDNIVDAVINKYPNTEDRTDNTKWHIISIDPLNSVDFDDAMSIIELDNNTKLLSIYISNVTLWMDILNLWNSFSQRISTIYLPDKKRPMLPTILSDCLCSLQKNVRRIAFVMDLYIKDDDIIDIQYKNAIINVYNNYVYEDENMMNDTHYHKILKTAQNLSHKYKYIKNINNSHDLVCYLMILMNYHCAKEMTIHKTGIFRSTIMKKEMFVPDTLPEEVNKSIKIWGSASGQYIDGKEVKDTRHQLLDLDAYIHITSPIRRLVDLLNMIKIQYIIGTTQLSENAQDFYQKWICQLDYINTTMRSIRKVQCDCALLDLCYNDPTMIEKIYDGYLLDKIIRNDGLFQYMVYLHELKLYSRITLRDNIDNFEKKNFKLFLFQDEERFKKKIRLHLL